jgi:SAM-dependent methyltransferase
MSKKVQRSGVREGYDQWSETYDSTANPLVALDRRHTLALLRPRAGERILDAGCGTGWNLRSLVHAGSKPVGIDFSRGMLTVARRNTPKIPLAQADLNHELPVRKSVFAATLCALVGEHLTNLPLTFRELFASLAPGGRLMFSVFHPEMAAVGIEANFERCGVEYRLGAYRYTVDDYLNVIEDCGFRDVQCYEFYGDDELVNEVPWATKYLRRPLLLAIAARKHPC